jgi:hypothetical protein
MSEAKDVNYILPSALISRADLARLVREVESVDSALETQKVKNDGQGSYRLPTMSQSLGDFLVLNKIDITDDHGRVALKEQLQRLKDKAPVIHMTFATAADPEALQDLVDWVRKELHPQALISTGLQPSLIGGVYMRTPNHVYDFSMRATMQGKRGVLVAQLEEFAK